MNSSKEVIIEKFNELQRDIDKALQISDNKYIFDQAEITKIVIDSNFDFHAYNAYFNTNYTKESFADIVINMIENTDLEYQPEDDNTCSVCGTYCGKNGTSSG
ncbi:MAG: hypothetical protein ACK5KR_01255 [Breznakia sp.]